MYVWYIYMYTYNIHACSDVQVYVYTVYANIYPGVKSTSVHCISGHCIIRQ